MIGSSIASLLDSLYPTRHGQLACSCGAVRIDLQVPGSSYGVVEQTCAHCHCRDCVGFTERCVRTFDPPVSLLNPAGGTTLCQFYRSDLAVVAGQDKIRCCRLGHDSQMVRAWCGVCGTPLGADLVGVPVVLLYVDLLHAKPNAPTAVPVYNPFVVLNYRPRDGFRSYDRRTVVRRSLIAPKFLFMLVSRIVLGFLFGKDKPGAFVPRLRQRLDGDSDPIPIGLDSIQPKDKKQH